MLIHVQSPPALLPPAAPCFALPPGPLRRKTRLNAREFSAMVLCAYSRVFGGFRRPSKLLQGVFSRVFAGVTGDSRAKNVQLFRGYQNPELPGLNPRLPSTPRACQEHPSKPAAECSPAMSLPEAGPRGERAGRGITESAPGGLAGTAGGNAPASTAKDPGLELYKYRLALKVNYNSTK